MSRNKNSELGVFIYIIYYVNLSIGLLFLLNLGSFSGKSVLAAVTYARILEIFKIFQERNYVISVAKVWCLRKIYLVSLDERFF